MELDPQLPLPPLLRELLAEGRWRQPPDDLIADVVPFLHEPVDFRLTEARLLSDSSAAYLKLPWFHLYRGSEYAERPLPWLDVEKQIFIAINRFPGDDVAIALDYRSSPSDPRVVASDWSEGDCAWREVLPTFSAFIAALRIKLR